MLPTTPATKFGDIFTLTCVLLQRSRTLLWPMEGWSFRSGLNSTTVGWRASLNDALKTGLWYLPNTQPKKTCRYGPALHTSDRIGVYSRL